MKSLTVKQPWAFSIAHLGKPIENRTWTTKHRGPIAIHAGKGWDVDGQDSALVRLSWRVAGQDLHVLTPNNSLIPLGAVVAVADLVDVCGKTFAVPAPNFCGCGPWASRSQYHWRLANVRALAEPVPCKGALGLWTLPADVEAAVVAQLGERANA
jgi:hypothetical protein